MNWVTNMKKMPILKYYRTVFIRILLCPLLIIGIISFTLLLSAQRNQQKKIISLAANTVCSTLNREFSDYALQFSSYLRANQNYILRLLTDYDKMTGKKRYQANRRLQELFSGRLISTMQIVSMDMLFDSKKKYHFMSYRSKAESELKKLSWYQEALLQPDVIHSSIVSSDSVLENCDSTVSDYLLAYGIPFHQLGGSTSRVKYGMITVRSEAIEMIHTANQWANGAEIGVVDAKGNLIIGSKNFISQSKTKGSLLISVKTKKNGLTVVAVMSPFQFVRPYQTILVFFSCSLLILFTILYLFIHRLLIKILKPINQLAVAMKSTENLSLITLTKPSDLLEIDSMETTYNTMVTRLDDYRKTIIKQEEEKRREELRVLELQINPHFITNALDSIRFMAIMAKFPSIEKMADCLIQNLTILFRNKNQFHSIKQELLLVSNYVTIMKIKYNDGFEYRTEIDTDILEEKIPILVFQPLVENAIVHGVAEKEERGLVRIEIHNKEDKISIIIYDNGNGMTKEKAVELTGDCSIDTGHIGIYNVKKRLQLYYGKDSFQFMINSKLGDYTSVSIILPKL